jgi:hypothetical protein
LLGINSIWTDGLAWTALGLGLAGGIANLTLRRTPATVSA